MVVSLLGFGSRTRPRAPSRTERGADAHRPKGTSEPRLPCVWVGGGLGQPTSVRSWVPPAACLCARVCRRGGPACPVCPQHRRSPTISDGPAFPPQIHRVRQRRPPLPRAKGPSTPPPMSPPSAVGPKPPPQAQAQAVQSSHPLTKLGSGSAAAVARRPFIDTLFSCLPVTACDTEPCGQPGRRL